MSAVEIHQAIEQGDEPRVRALLAADPTLAGARDARGVSAVMKALYHRRRPLVDLLLASAPPPDVFEAASLGREERLAALLGDDPALALAWSPDGATALHFAAFFGQVECARLLLEHGADPAGHANGFGGVAPLHSALASRSYEVARLLLEKGAPVDAVQEGGWTALMAAALHGEEALAELLLDHGADPLKKADDGSDAVSKAEGAGHGGLAARLRAVTRT
jgi:ankyrin repeat protein